MIEIFGMEMSLKLLTWYGAIGFYALAGLYALFVLAMYFSKGGLKAEGDLIHRKLSSYSLDDIIRLSEEADAYEMVEAPYDAQYLAQVAADIASQFELSEEDKESLRVAALLHDIGQVENFDFIQEERALRPDEKRRLKEHPIYGYQYILEHLGKDYENAAKWVRWSHESWDGTGYPDALAGEQIPLPARILAVVDAYCAMSQNRPYRPALSQDEVIAELNKYAGSKFDPQVVQLFGVAGGAAEEAEQSALEI